MAASDTGFWGITIEELNDRRKERVDLFVSDTDRNEDQIQMKPISSSTNFLNLLPSNSGKGTRVFGSKFSMVCARFLFAFLSTRITLPTVNLILLNRRRLQVPLTVQSLRQFLLVVMEESGVRNDDKRYRQPQNLNYRPGTCSQSVLNFVHEQSLVLFTGMADNEISFLIILL